MRLGMTILRVTVGGLFAGHGTQKLFGWFGGHGLDGTGGFFQSKLGLRPGRAHATAAALAEAGGGALLATGFLTPLGALLTSSTMAAAIRLVHKRNGLWNSDGGAEYNLVLMAAAFAITAAGPGRWSLDAARGREQWGDGWAVAQLAGALAGSALAVEAGRRLAERGATAEAEPQQAPPLDDAHADTPAAADRNGQPAHAAA
ncbi:MAG: DoxX family protein [Actinobacteria bacterium]|nr:DoxX family protein [Actinomycetota bacterium]